MKELIRTDDLVLLSLLEVGLDDASIKYVILDRHTASVYGGALPAVNARVMVDEDDLDASKRVLSDIQSTEEPPGDD